MNSHGTGKEFFTEAWFLSSFSIAVTKHYEQDNSQKEAFNLGSEF